MQGTFIILTEKQFHEITSKLDQILGLLKEPSAADYKRLGKWIKKADALELLGVSESTLQKYRFDGMLNFSQIGNKIYIDGESIEDMLERNSVKAMGRQRR